VTVDDASQGTPRSEFPTDLRTLVNMWAWRDASFRHRLLEDPGAAIAELTERLGIDLPYGVEFRVVEDDPGVFTIPLAQNPVGASPAEFVERNYGKAAQIESAEEAIGSGAFWSITAECFCSLTETGGCPCTNTHYGTPCLSCSLADFCAAVMLLEVE
jgi:hypothetical protein